MFTNRVGLGRPKKIKHHAAYEQETTKEGSLDAEYGEKVKGDQLDAVTIATLKA